MTPSSASVYKMTTKEFFDLPEGPPYFQLIDGDLYMSPGPRRYHQRISMLLGSELHAFIEDHQLGELYAAPSDVVLSGHTVVEPDLYFVSRERAHILNDQGTNGAPDLVVEILSPSTAKLDLGVKRVLYAKSGVLEMWVVVPETKTIEVYRFAEKADEPVATLGVQDALSTDILPGLTLAIRDVFRA